MRPARDFFIIQLSNSRGISQSHTILFHRFLKKKIGGQDKGESFEKICVGNRKRPAESGRNPSYSAAVNWYEEIKNSQLTN